MREKIDKYYLQYNYSLNDNSAIDLLEEDSTIIEGDFNAFNTLYDFIIQNDMAKENFFLQVSQQIDLNSLVDYYIVQWWFSNVDWPYNNIKYWRNKNENGKWRYLLFDLDDVMMGHHVVHPSTDHLNFLFGPFGDNNRHIQIFKRLLQNENFKHFFINRYADLMNTVLTETYLSKQLEKSTQNISRSIPLQFEKWETDTSIWHSEINDKINYFIKERPAFARQFVQDMFSLEKQLQIHIRCEPPNAASLHINTVQIDTLPWSGIYYEIPINLKAIVNQGYYFDYWSAKHTFNKNTNLQIHYTFLQDDTLTIHCKPALKQRQKLIVFPNPITNKNEQLHLQYDMPQASQINIQLMDIRGNTLILFTNINVHEGINDTFISLPDISETMYFVKVYNDTFSYSSKIICLH